MAENLPPLPPVNPTQSDLPATTPVTMIIRPEEHAHLAAIRIQKKALSATKVFLVGLLESDEEEESDDSDGEDGTGEDRYKECKKFFLKLFEDEELKTFCEKNWGGGAGEFMCLVCNGIGKSKRFKNLVAAVQHSAMIRTTKKKIAHRAYAHVVCEAVGWDIDHLPTYSSWGTLTLTEIVALLDSPLFFLLVFVVLFSSL